MRASLFVFFLATWCLGAGCSPGSSSRFDEDDDNGGDTDSDGDTDGDTDTGTGTDIPIIPETCVAANAMFSSVGCEFFIADLDQGATNDTGTFAVVVSNPHQSQDAVVSFEDMRGPGGTLRTLPAAAFGGYDNVAIAPGEIQVFRLACAIGCPVVTAHIDFSGIARRGAFRLISDVPVLAYQWNLYGENGYSTDASLLLPSTSLGTRYIGATWRYGWIPWAPTIDNRAELAVVAMENGTTVTITPVSDTAPGGELDQMTAGVTAPPIALNIFDIVQIAPVDHELELSGTVIESNKPVAVFGAHSCAMVPEQHLACDHVEEQLLPFFAWGTETILARHSVRPLLTAETDPVVWRIVAGADNMTVYFDPAVDSIWDTIGGSYHFEHEGDLLQLMSPYDHYLNGVLDDPPDPTSPEAPFFAFQMMTGRCFLSTTMDCLYPWGDPLMLLAPPAGQYLDRYVFATDQDFDFQIDEIIVVRPSGVQVTVDCLGTLPDAGFTPVGSTDWETGRFFLDHPNGVPGCQDGPHTLTAEAPVALSVVGIDQANSYGYLGGVGIRAINPLWIE